MVGGSGPAAVGAMAAVQKRTFGPAASPKELAQRQRAWEHDVMFLGELRELRQEVDAAKKAGANVDTALFEKSAGLIELRLAEADPQYPALLEVMSDARGEARQIAHKTSQHVGKGKDKLVARGALKVALYTKLPFSPRWRAFEQLCAGRLWGKAALEVAPLDQLLTPEIEDFVPRLEEIATQRLPWVIQRAGNPTPATLAGFQQSLAQRHTLGLANLTELDVALKKDFVPLERTATNKCFGDAKTDAGKGTALDEMSDNKVIRQGAIQRKYRSSYDKHDEFSVECLVDGLQDIVVHAHCDSGGAAKPGNGTKWKYKDEKYAAGASHPLTDKQRKGLVDAKAAKAAAFTK